MSIGIHIATDVISTATLSRGGDFVFYEQIETPIDDTNALCRGIAELVESASLTHLPGHLAPSASPSMLALAASHRHQIRRPFWPKLM